MLSNFRDTCRESGRDSPSGRVAHPLLARFRRVAHPLLARFRNSNPGTTPIAGCPTLSGAKGGCFDFFKDGHHQLHPALFTECVPAIAAPLPIRRGRRQTTAHRIVVHVAGFFRALFLREHVEVIKPSLPKRFRKIFFRPKRGLALIGSPARATKAVRSLLLEQLHHGGWPTLLSAGQYR